MERILLNILHARSGRPVSALVRSHLKILFSQFSSLYERRVYCTCPKRGPLNIINRKGRRIKSCVLGLMSAWWSAVFDCNSNTYESLQSSWPVIRWKPKTILTCTVALPNWPHGYVPTSGANGCTAQDLARANAYGWPHGWLRELGYLNRIFPRVWHACQYWVNCGGSPT